MSDSVDKTLASLLATGGDARIRIDPATGLNRYLSAPYPRLVLAYASSTANDVSDAAFAHLRRWWTGQGRALDADGYRAHLNGLRARIAAAYRLPMPVETVFAPSGTDLEYVALAAVAGRAPGGILNVLIGSDEVGTGCIHSANGRHFAEETALDAATVPGSDVAGLGERVTLADIPVREADGTARASAAVAAAIDAAIAGAHAEGRFPLIHIVHGSKTGLILPDGGALDRLISRHGDAAAFVVDACQARITGAAVSAYLKRGVIVLLTGSKFMGGPPFSGVALLPAGTAAAAPPLPEGFAAIFRRAEWPDGWPGAAALVDAPNAGLALRWEASIFELERFAALPPDAAARVIAAFGRAVAALAARIGAAEVRPFPPGAGAAAAAHPLEMRTLATLDLSARAGGADFEAAQSWHRAMALAGVRLGQPVRCVRLPNGRWGATLRIGLSMPTIHDLAALDENALAAALDADMARIERALEKAAG